MITAELSARADTRRLQEYFDAARAAPSATPIGMEVETSFLDESRRPITIDQSQQIFRTLAGKGWNVAQTKGSILSVLTSPRGDKLLYEVGRQNLEIATVPTSTRQAVHECRMVLEELYEAAALHRAYPSYKPIVETKDDLLIIPDERDAIWDALDGREALKMIAWMSAVQFTVEVPPEKALQCLNNLGAAIGRYLADYPQDSIWRDYIRTSNANYREDRYGGPLQFDGLPDYCGELAKHDVVQGPTLVPYGSVRELDIPLYLRSIWWYFRLRRYGERLCIEIRPLARRHDSLLHRQLDLVLETLAL
ncbi:hypothetical protein HY970_03255 [Candidatus Kaiserbacteria bacterium]|nr:hypothetical protein [Candidatus Kaiserbacteria bacterium]